MRVTWIALAAAALAPSACGDNRAGAPDAVVPDAARPGLCRSFAPKPPIAFVPRADGFAPLASVAVPMPVGGDIVDFDAAARLGKLLFWDTQASSDGQVACATCHFAAGADARVRNAMNPGPDGRYGGNGVTGPGQPALAENTVGDDRFASEGVVGRQFVALPGDPASAVDECTADVPAVFGGFRQVTPRNTPTVFGAVYLAQVFWDGRASAVFDGVDPFGGTANAGAASVHVTQAALASQATAPVVNDVEMSCAGRTLDGPAGVGAKLLGRAPLAHQVVALDDGALGCLSRAPAPGVTCGDAGACTYRELFTAAFGAALVGADADAHFARLWGQAIAAYEATLVPDDTPFDRWLTTDPLALTEHQRQGLHAFSSSGCTKCHAGAELSDASASFAATHGALNVDGGDRGFHDTGVRETTATSSEDLGRATLGPAGASYSASGAAADRGAFKTAMLRNVGLTAPYFHTGGKATLDDVVEFYARGGDFPGTASDLHAFNFLPGEQKALIDFLQTGLTDCRVATSAAPFDHPSLAVVDGPTLPAVGAAGTGAGCP